MLLNCSNADSKFSAISVAKISGDGRFSVSSRLSSFNHNISKFALKAKVFVMLVVVVACLQHGFIS